MIDELNLNLDYVDFLSVVEKICDSAMQEVSNVKPSDWYESNRIMTRDLSSMTGAFKYSNTPYAKEIVDCLSPTHPSTEIAVMKGAQLGLSAGVVEPAVGWIISQQPGPTLYLVGHEDNVKGSMSKVDKMIDGTGIRELIKSTTQRVRNTKSGDTDKRKDFSGGWLMLNTTNYKSLREFSVQYGFIDDYEAMKSASKEAGDTRTLIMQRFSAFKQKKKIFYISSPELKEGSNIEAVYLMGDQRKFHIPCPCCDQLIVLEWETPSELNQSDRAGVTWQLDEKGELAVESVGYTCQKCGGFFNDSNKMDLLQAGKWIATAKPVRPDFYSYHISALYAPVFMDGWLEYVYKFIEANPVGGQQDIDKMKAFKNVVLGETYEPQGESIKATELQKNIRPYDILTVPEKQSIEDGNGRIVLLTCAADINGKEDDARLDYEVVAWSETGATYSVDHGSVGTFIPKDPGKVDRSRWTYKHNAHQSVWPVFKEILTRQYNRDSGKPMKILSSGIDAGYMTKFVYEFVDNSNLPTLYSLKGKDEDKYLRIDADRKTFRQSKEKRNLFLVESNVVKDQLAQLMQLTYDPNYHEAQPAGFMNFPTPSDGKYLYLNYFSHFEAEHKILDKRHSFIWVKKSNNHQNHQYDNRCYNMAVKDIFLSKLFKELKIVNGIWSDYVNMIFKR